MVKLALACVLVFTASLGAQCATASCFGPLGTDPLVISGAWIVASGANLDFGPRHVILASGASLNLIGPVSITAARITGQPGSLIDGTTVAMSDLSITTTPAGAHDGSVTFSGTIDLNGWGPPGLGTGWGGGNLTVNAGGPVSVTWVDTTGGFSQVAGSVTIMAPSINVGTILADANDYYSTAGNVTLTSTGPVTVGSIHAQTTDFSGGAQVNITGSSYTQTGDLLAGGWPGSGYDASPCSVTITVPGAASIQGPIASSDPACTYGGSITITAGGALTWTGALGVASGRYGGVIVVRSLASNVVINGTLEARALLDDPGSSAGGTIQVQAAGQLDYTGSLDVSSAQSALDYGSPAAWLTAGQSLWIHAGSVVQSRDLSGGCTSFGGWLSLEGCHVVIESGASVVACGNFPLGGSVVNVVTHDVLTVNGSISAGGPLSNVFVHSRLPWPGALAGSGTISPPPMVTVEPGLPACPNATTTVTTTSPVSAGQPITITVTGPPLRSLLIGADFALAHLPLGAYGWTQVNLLTAALIADDLGILGAPIPGATDSGGVWSWSIVTPVVPQLMNVDVYFDVYVIDLGAPNGLFHQPPYATIHFN